MPHSGQIGSTWRCSCWARARVLSHSGDARRRLYRGARRSASTPGRLRLARRDSRGCSGCPPTAATSGLGEFADAAAWRAGHRRKDHALGDSLGLAVLTVQHRGAHRAGLRHRRPVHQAVDYQHRPIAEQLRPRRRARPRPRRTHSPQGPAARRQGAALGCDRFGLSAQRDRGGQQEITRGASVGVLVREPDGVGREVRHGDLPAGRRRTDRAPPWPIIAPAGNLRGDGFARPSYCAALAAARPGRCCARVASTASGERPSSAARLLTCSSARAPFSWSALTGAWPPWVHVWTISPSPHCWSCASRPIMSPSGLWARTSFGAAFASPPTNWPAAASRESNRPSSAPFVSFKCASASAARRRRRHGASRSRCASCWTRKCRPCTWRWPRRGHPTSSAPRRHGRAWARRRRPAPASRRT